jgi:predicted acyl esterase
MGRTVIGGDVLFERDIAVPMRDGTRLRANVFRPAGERRVPALMSVTPHGKDKLPDRLGIRCGGRFDSHLLLPVTRGEIVPAP